MSDNVTLKRKQSPSLSSNDGDKKPDKNKIFPLIVLAVLLVFGIYYFYVKTNTSKSVEENTISAVVSGSKTSVSDKPITNAQPSKTEFTETRSQTTSEAPPKQVNLAKSQNIESKSSVVSKYSPEQTESLPRLSGKSERVISGSSENRVNKVSHNIKLDDIDHLTNSSRYKVYQFPFNSADISKSNIELLRLVEILKNKQQLKVLIAGYSDKNGSVAYNLILSQRRAASVFNYLKSQGIDEQRIKCIGRGILKRYSSDADNRIVEFSVIN